MSEKRRIVELTLGRKSSVAEVSRAYGLNSNQLFKWRRAYERGELSESSTALIPVRVSSIGDDTQETEETPASRGGAIHIEFPGRAVISVESGADPSLVRWILESLRK